MTLGGAVPPPVGSRRQFAVRIVAVNCQQPTFPEARGHDPEGILVILTGTTMDNCPFLEETD